MTMHKDQCPRCGGFIPNNKTPGAYPGALSRTDNSTYVCSECGRIEAAEDAGGHGAMPQFYWYINDEQRKWVDWGWACKHCGDLEMLEATDEDTIVNGPFLDGACKHCVEDNRQHIYLALEHDINVALDGSA